MTNAKFDLTDRAIFPRWNRNTIRFNDTDRLGHVNHAVFVTLCESGRSTILDNPKARLVPEGFSVVVVRLTIDYRSELHWPSEVETGTGVLSLGRSSFVIAHGLFVENRCVATAEVVSVMTDVTTRKSTPLTEAMRVELAAVSCGTPSSLSRT